jgi:hypothetical protein
LDGLFGDKLNKMILSFFKIVVRKGRSQVLYATGKEFINQYRKYLYSEHINQSDIDFAKGRLWLSYADATGGDKPMTIMLFGDITTSLELEIKEAINNLYIVKCEDCDSVMEARKKTGFLYCKKCNES